jgi:hypothetical protein
MVDAAAGESGDESECLERALSKLRVDERRLIELRNYPGATWESVAKLAGYLSPVVARNAHAKALVALGKHLRAMGQGSGE